MMQFLKNKEYRERTTVLLAFVALVISLLSVAWNEFRSWRRERGNFQIEVGEEYHGPISLITLDEDNYLEGFAHINIFNHGSRTISVEYIWVDMLNMDTLTGQLISRKPVDDAKHLAYNEQQTGPETLGLIAFEEPFYTECSKATFPNTYGVPISLPLNVPPFSQVTVYFKIRTLLLEGKAIYELIGVLLSSHPRRTAGQFISDVMEKGITHARHYMIEDKHYLKPFGPNTAELRVTVRSHDNVSRESRLNFP